MKSLSVEIHNFIKIHQATFDLKPFTIIGGKNASGKSSITQALNTLLRTLNKDHLSIDFDSTCQQINNQIELIEQYQQNFSKSVTLTLNELNTAYQSFLDTIDQQFDLNTPKEQSVETNNYRMVLADKIQRLIDSSEHFAQVISQSKKYKFEQHYISQTRKYLDSLLHLIKNPSLYLSSTATKQLFETFSTDFQVANISSLKNKRFSQEESYFWLDNRAVLLAIGNKGAISTQIPIDSAKTIQQIENVIYLESPAIWAFKEVLSQWATTKHNPEQRRRLKHQDKELTRIPQYVLDIFALIDRDIIQQQRYPALEEIKHQIQTLIGGHIQIDSFGKIQFVEKINDHEVIVVDINQVSSGTKSLGMIGLLLDKYAIVPNSILIFDEPEINLHPAWQHVMVQLLYKLSLAGVTVVMASHSYDMLEAVEQCIERHNGELDQHFSIIQLHNGNTINHDKPLFKKLDAVKADLSKPIYDLFSGS